MVKNDAFDHHHDSGRASTLFIFTTKSWWWGLTSSHGSVRTDLQKCLLVVKCLEASKADLSEAEGRFIGRRRPSYRRSKVDLWDAEGRIIGGRMRTCRRPNADLPIER